MQRSDGQQHQSILENAECRAAMQTAETDEEDTAVSEHVVPMTLREARVAAHALKICVQSKYLGFSPVSCAI